MSILNRKPDRSRVPVVIAIVIVGVVFAIVGAVVLAGVLGTFVLSTGEQAGPTPSVSFQFGVSDGTATIAHAGGDSFSAGEMLVVTADTEQSWASLSGEDGPVELVYVGGDGRELVGRFSA
ncbi:type IV pilin N-terminal domain-containing protein [Haloferax denitrificans]|uniref:type IV pilin N-terminal domain-containing protein n=1 Tax=Haloferax denitrificans TaxID=35745 RepID=UPI003C6FFC18